MAKYQITKEVSVHEYAGMKIKELRESKRMKQEDLADRISIGRTSVANIEIGRQKLTLENIEQFCEALGCRSTDILPF